jgi:hypothetical protein
MMESEAKTAARGGAPVPEACAAAAGGQRPAKSKAKRTRKPTTSPRRTVVRWSVTRETIFLETLALTSNVAASIRASGFSETHVYRRRGQDETFRCRWHAALCEGYTRLETALLRRAINGVRRPLRDHLGKTIGSVVEYNDRVGLSLLALHRTTVRTAEPERANDRADDVLDAMLGDMNRAMGGAG